MNASAQLLEVLSTRIELKSTREKVSFFLNELLHHHPSPDFPLTAAEVRTRLRKYERAHRRNFSDLLLAMRDE